MALVTNMFDTDSGYPDLRYSGGTAYYTNVNPGDGSTRSVYLKGSTSYVEMFLTPKKEYAMNSTHVYYFSAKVYYPDTINGSFDFYWPIAEPSAMSGATATEAKTWTRISSVFTRTDFSSGSYQCRFDYNNANNGTVEVYVSSMMLVDLTETFGAGSEPDKDWCDTVLPFIGTSGYYSTLAELFSATADAVRAVYQSSDTVYPSKVPGMLQQIAGVATKMVQTTQSEYDALSTKDSTTLYFIT